MATRRPASFDTEPLSQAKRLINRTNLSPTIDATAAARTAETRGEGFQTFQLLRSSAEEARAWGQHTFEGFEYYCTDAVGLN